MSKKPRIGITLDAENDGKYSAFPYLALRENYADCIAEAGAAPLMLPHHPDAVAEYLNVLDALVVTGGNFDIDPALYGAGNRHESVITKDRRTRFEWAIMQCALDKNIPILGICGGHQLLNVMLGGTLLQHIPDDIPNALEHQQRLAGTPQGQPHHTINIAKDTLLHKITCSLGYKTNSSHHQAVRKLGKGLVANATTKDGVIEGIELPEKRFVLGLEWHPEYLATPEDKRIIAAFVASAH